ncbi:MAG TPA: hypothetical protein VFA80_17560 [Xanthobacteraceae bacterium]|jgi:hypothetical protein|nr:hypothetical protein [Xanthobacteraceae bacterium]
MTAKLRLAGLVLLASLPGITSAAAQSFGPDEAVGPPGSVLQQTVLSPQQRRAIYEAVVRQGGQFAGPAIAAMVGAPVPPSLLLQDLPDPVVGNADQMADDPNARVLKYAMVADDVVVIDPIVMRVVDVIHRAGVKP